MTTTMPASIRPTAEQLERIAQLSQAVYRDPRGVYDHHPYPSTRIEASNLIKTLDRSRTHDDPADIEALTEATPEEKPMDDQPVEKTCSTCRETKPIDAFGIARLNPDGRNYRCRDCISKRDKARRVKKSGGTDVNRRRPRANVASPVNTTVTTATPRSEPDPPLSTLNGDWQTRFTDPTLSQLIQLQAFFGLDSLDETARITTHIALALSELSARKEPT